MERMWEPKMVKETAKDKLAMLIFKLSKTEEQFELGCELIARFEYEAREEERALRAADDEEQKLKSMAQ
jgi:hypothetical protein